MRGLIGPAGTDLLKQAEGNTGTEELAHVLGGELAEALEDVLFNLRGLSLGIACGVGDHRGRKVGVVDGVMDGDRELVASVVVDHSTCDTGPHRLHGMKRRCMRMGEG